jgi:predicted nuclease with TOPRIM domain
MAKIKYIRRKDIVEGKKDLPSNLSFLSSTIKFYAIAIHKKGERKQTRIEFLPSPLKNYVESINNASMVNNENKKLKEELNNLQDSLAQSQEKVNQLQRENEKLREENYKLETDNRDLINIVKEYEKKPDYNPHSSMKSYLHNVDEKVTIFRGIPISGGLPGSGKKK